MNNSKYVGFNGYHGSGINMNTFDCLGMTLDAVN